MRPPYNFKGAIYNTSRIVQEGISRSSPFPFGNAHTWHEDTFNNLLHVIGCEGKAPGGIDKAPVTDTDHLVFSISFGTHDPAAVSRETY